MTAVVPERPPQVEVAPWVYGAGDPTPTTPSPVPSLRSTSPRRALGKQRKLAALAIIGVTLAGGAGGGAAAVALTRSSAATATAGTAVNGTTFYAAAAAAALPSIVSLKVAHSGRTAQGSGVILTATGLIVTDEHVIVGAVGGGTITVAFSDGRSARAEIVGRDASSDIAVLKVSGVRDLKPATLASGPLRVGETVLAIGNPLGLPATVTSGVVSAVNRDTVQADVPVSPGNSGGALVDSSGRVAAITTAAASQSSDASASAGVAIPIAKALAAAKTLTPSF